jgi:hypothetical protein
MSFIFNKPLKRHQENVEADYKKGIAYYGLNKDVIFCKSSVISNQRPNSEYEYKHTSKTKKRTVIFEDNLCQACKYASIKNKMLTGKRERKNCWDDEIDNDSESYFGNGKSDQMFLDLLNDESLWLTQHQKNFQDISYEKD